ncbi:MAG: alpha-amylase [Bacteroidales bacterium]|nr:alpha-amylase [Candidatus Cacconaster equi]
MLVRAFGTRDCVPGSSYGVNGSGKFSDITDEYLRKLKQLSIGAVWYTGVISHATKTHFRGIPDCNSSIVKGEAGSPYAIRNYFDVDPALARNVDNRMAEFQALVDRTHKAGMKVIIDFVPNHVFREYNTYFTKENFYILNEPLHLPGELCSNYIENPAKATGNDVFSAYPSVSDWYETAKLNYGSHSTWEKMLDILKFWASKGVDGFRCDMVEMVPADFFKWAFSEVRKSFPSMMFIAEVYQKSNYQNYASAGFDLLYDKSGFYDALRGIIAGARPASDLTREWQDIGDLQPKMLNFLENHDEQRVASDFFAGSGRSAFPALAVSLLFNTAPFMIYFGQEFGERGMEAEGFSGRDGRTSIYDYCIVPSIKRFLLDRLSLEESLIYKEYCRLMRIATADSIFSKGKTFDLMYANPASSRFNPQKQFVWMRGYAGAAMVIVANFDSTPVEVDVCIPQEAFDYFGIERKATVIHTRVNARDYMRVDISE